MKLGDFVETHIEVDNYSKKVKDKLYDALDFPYLSQVIDIIEKIKRKCPDIALVCRGNRTQKLEFQF